MKKTSLKSQVDRQWIKVRDQWFKDHPADAYYCYMCGKFLHPPGTDSVVEKAVLDHVEPKSGLTANRKYDPTNLKPSCWSCNAAKGSKRLKKD